MKADSWHPQRISFRNSDGLPKYVAIARAIALAITDGEFAAGDPLPSQKTLAERFGVTIMTVRQAIQLLTEQGMVLTEQGKGTYVQNTQLRLTIGQLTSLDAQLEANGRTLRTEVLSFATVEVSPIEQQRMSLASAEAYELVRLRFADEVPLIMQTSLLPPALAAGITGEDLREQSLYQILETRQNVRIERATETIQVTRLDEESARLLRCEAGEPALLSSRLTFDSTGTPVVDDRALTAGNAVVIATERHMTNPGSSLLYTHDASRRSGNVTSAPRDTPAHHGAVS